MLKKGQPHHVRGDGRKCSGDAGPGALALMREVCWPPDGGLL